MRRLVTAGYILLPIDPCITTFHTGWIGSDVAIGVWNSASTKVLNNTILLSGDYPNAIEYRFQATTGVTDRFLPY